MAFLFSWDFIVRCLLTGFVAGLAAALSNARRERAKAPRIYLAPLRPIPELFVHEN